jgi:hypothetical protein
MADIGFTPRVIARPACPRCGTRMLLIRIFPDRPGYDQRIYECPWSPVVGLSLSHGVSKPNVAKAPGLLRKT